MKGSKNPKLNQMKRTAKQMGEGEKLEGDQEGLECSVGSDGTSSAATLCGECECACVEIAILRRPDWLALAAAHERKQFAQKMHRQSLLAFLCTERRHLSQ